ncbi:beta-ketoacyl synthase N-terminal-like domain-containing protein [Streptomyces sp. NPDC001480]|uniref:beta-ketoacyl synthase N-terminal-like domain-containing protein n=1 Tax=Streptomyces sp. NPDC001480 TaxID=3364577 RepID=UPI0036D0B129
MDNVGLDHLDHKEILRQFKDGTLDRGHALTLLSGAFRADAGRPEPGEPAPTAAPPPVDEGIAVIGLSGRYPQAPDLEAFCRQTLAARDTAAVPAGDATGTPAERGHLLDGLDEFDPEFYGLTESEAALTDPRLRLFLDTAWDALENAGYTGARLEALTTADGDARSVGVWAAAGSGEPHADGTWVLPNRLSTLLDLRGPSQSVDTAESSFLVAVHLAATALRAGECAAALVCGLELRPRGVRHQDGAGEGAGAVLLRPLAAARAAGDIVQTVLRASAVVHTGRGDGRDSDARLTRRTLSAADLQPADVTLQETGASVARAVGRAGAAIGAAVLTRAALQIRAGTLAPARPDADALPWPRTRDAQGAERARRAMVTVHGVGGTAAQVVLEEPPPAGEHSDPPTPDHRGEELLLMSAPTPTHLAATARRMADWLTAAPDGTEGTPSLAALARELRVGRSAMNCRLALTARDTGTLAAALDAVARDPYPGEGPVRCAEVGPALGEPPLADLPETRDYLRALWRGRRFEQLARLWLAGVDVTVAAEPGPRVMSLPATVRLPRALPGGPATERER